MKKSTSHPKFPRGLLTRSVSSVTKGLLRIDQEYRIQGEAPGQDCIGRYWIFGICRVTQGKIDFLQRDQRITVPWKTFGMFLPPFSIVQVKLVQTHSQNIGFLSSLPLPPSAPKAAVIFDMTERALPQSPHQILSLIGNIQNAIPISRGHGCNAMADRIKRAVDASYREPIKLAEIARKVNLTPDLMSRTFKRAFGTTPVKYRNLLRITEAMAKLCDGSPILETSGELGYGDLSQFYDRFAEVAWATPGEYKPKKVKKPQEILR